MLDRDELAARFAVAAYGDGREWNGTREDLAEYAVKQADALLAALASKPAATGAHGPCPGEDARDDAEARKRLAVPPPAPTPAPEAKRPTHVRITNSASPSRFKDGDVLRVVKWIDEVPAVDVAGYDVSGYVLYDSKWAPAPCPPPVAGSEVGIPRRIDISRQTPIEAAIRAARAAVEAGPAHPHMTRATTLLGQALDAVADFVDGVPEVRP